MSPSSSPAWLASTFPFSETIRGFKEIVEGKHDDIPESAFLFAGTIDDVVAKAKGGNA